MQHQVAVHLHTVVHLHRTAALRIAAEAHHLVVLHIPAEAAQVAVVVLHVVQVVAVVVVDNHNDPLTKENYKKTMYNS